MSNVMSFQSVDLFEKRTFEAECVMIFSKRRFENIITHSASNVLIQINQRFENT